MIYLDNNATTRLATEARDAMLPWLGDEYGNPSAGYRFGRAARKAIDHAREQVAGLINAQTDEIVFTSGGTESNNTAIRSAIALRPDKKMLLASSVEHSAVDEVLRTFDPTGLDVRLNPVDSIGQLDLDKWKENLETDDGILAALIWANNETGVYSPIEKAAGIAAEHDTIFHTDAVQAVGKIPIDVSGTPIHTLSMSAHKLHGPKGIGALYVNSRTRFHSLMIGGGQESDRRSGTENVPGIVGFGVAAELAMAHFAETAALAELRDQFEKEILEQIEGVEINGAPANRLPNTSNLYFPGVDGEGLLILLDEAGVCCSPGSACSTGDVKPSRIVKAMGFSSSRARSSVRFSFSRYNNRDEVSDAVAAVKKSVDKLRIVMPSGSGRVVVSSRS